MTPGVAASTVGFFFLDGGEKARNCRTGGAFQAAFVSVWLVQLMQLL